MKIGISQKITLIRLQIHGLWDKLLMDMSLFFFFGETN
jgi:hypothetical protein